MQEGEGKIVVPVIQEEVHADVKPVQTGSVRVTKSVETHDELIEHELRTGHADVKRVQVNRVVDGPQQPYRTGNTLVIPLVSEVLQGCEKQWVLTEEIRITQLEQTETIQQKVPVTSEHVRVERLDAQGNVIHSDAVPPERPAFAGPAAEAQAIEAPVRIDDPVQKESRLAAPSMLKRRAAAAADPANAPSDAPSEPPARKVLSSPKGILSKRSRKPGKSSPG